MLPAADGLVCDDGSALTIDIPLLDTLPTGGSELVIASGVPLPLKSLAETQVVATGFEKSATFVTSALLGKVVSSDVGLGRVATDEAAADEVAADEVAADEVAADEVAADEVAADEVAADEVAVGDVAASDIAFDGVALGD
jgi:hypothetical protein